MQKPGIPPSYVFNLENIPKHSTLVFRRQDWHDTDSGISERHGLIKNNYSGEDCAPYLERDTPQTVLENDSP